jgi:hypothetical protein
MMHSSGGAHDAFEAVALMCRVHQGVDDLACAMFQADDTASLSSNAAPSPRLSSYQ